MWVPASWEILDGVGVGRDGGSFSLFFSFFFVFFRFSLFFFMCLLVLGQGRRAAMSGHTGTFTPTLSAPTPIETSRTGGLWQIRS